MQNETVTQSHVLPPGVEVSFGLLTSPHALTEIIVNANGQARANHSSWRLYDTAAAGGALVWEGILTPPFAIAQRLTPKEGITAGGLLELRAFNTGEFATAGPVTASLIGFDPECCDDGGGDANDAFLNQPIWYFDAVSGDDTNNGLTPFTALQHWAEWLRRIRSTPNQPFTILSPTGGLLQLIVLTDLPDDDPTTFRALMAPGCTAVSFGQDVELTTGVCTALVPEDPATNTPWTLTAVVPGGWAAFLGKCLEITSGAGTGSRAYIARDLGADAAHLTAWGDPAVGPDGFVIPGVSPDVGDVPFTFRILDFTSVVNGETIVGFNRADQPPTGPPGGFVQHHFHFRRNSGVDQTNTTALDFADSPTAWAYCIVDGPTLVTALNNSVFANCCLNGTSSLIRGKHVVTFGLSRNTDPGEYPGGWNVSSGAELVGYKMALVGAGGPADLLLHDGGLTTQIQLSTWDCAHGIAGRTGATAYFQDDVFFGESNIVPLWGNGNDAEIYLFAGASMLFDLFLLDSPVKLPSWEGQNGPGGVVGVLSGTFWASPNQELGWAWDVATSTFLPVGGAPVTWANLLVPCTGGGFQETDYNLSPDFEVRIATACNPSQDSKIVWSTGIFTTP